MRFDNMIPQPYSATFGNSLKNTGTIRFRIFDDNQANLINVAGNLNATGGVFEVVSETETYELGDEFQLLNVTGSFDAESYTLELPELPQGLFWDRSDFVSEGLIRIVDFLLGDVNQDGVVDLLDVAPFVDLIINGQYQVEADINMDGEVNLLDVAGLVQLISG